MRSRLGSLLDNSVVTHGVRSNLQSWALQYTGGSQSNWVTIASGSTSVVAGLLGHQWDTTTLDEKCCCYTLRLVVTDKSIVNCNGAIHQQAIFMTSVHVSEDCPQSASAVSNVGLALLAMLLAGAGGVALRRRRLAAV